MSFLVTPSALRTAAVRPAGVSWPKKKMAAPANTCMAAGR
jgi:hypothetical protein